MENAISKDGTKIAFEKSGEGPALIIVGGSLADHRFYAPLSNELAKHFTVYNFDRRGRGQSGDTLPYAVEREIEDVGALIAKAKESVFLYGHSAGAALALRAAAADSNILKLVLADPPYTPHGENDETAKAEYSKESARIQELHDNGDHKANAALFLGGFGLPADDVNGMLESPAGGGMIECARALPYDYAMLGDGLVPTELAAKVKIPTVILAAKAAPETAQALLDTMAGARLEAMEAPTHELPPEIIGQVLRNFLK